MGWHKLIIGSVYCFVEVYISAKFEENPSVSIGFIVQPRQTKKIDGRHNKTI